MAVIKNKKGGSPCHTFTTITVDDQMYWFEASWEGQKGIRKFSDIEIKELIEITDNIVFLDIPKSHMTQMLSSSMNTENHYSATTAICST